MVTSFSLEGSDTLLTQSEQRALLPVTNLLRMRDFLPSVTGLNFAGDDPSAHA